ncbi:MAG: hypothetical protein Fur0022_17710 [Anaerolineales bacterium]
MLVKIRKIFAPPTFEDEDKTRVAGLLNTILWSLLALLFLINLFVFVMSILTGTALPDLTVSFVGVAVFAGMLILLHRGFVRSMSYLLAFVIIGVITLSILRSTTLNPAILSGYLVAVIVAGLLIGGRGAFTAAIVTLLIVANLGYFAEQGWTTVSPLLSTQLISFGAIILNIAFLLGLAFRTIETALAQARRNEKELIVLAQSLEHQVAERTRALAASTEVSRRLSTILDPDQLIKEVVNQVQQAFNFYHVHIYLFDPARENLLMVGGTGEAGRTMLANKHTIPAGRGLVGQAATTNQIVLVPETTAEPKWLPNPLLPETKSEVAVPISIGTTVLGVLDVQHNIAGGLRQEDADLLQAIANQVAIALQNAQAYEVARRRAEQETIVNALAREIQQATRVEDVLQIVASGLGRSMDVKRAIVQVHNTTVMNGSRSQ